MRSILRLFSGLNKSESFYLTGGTALSNFYLKHRLSFDLDLFLPFKFKNKSPNSILEFSQILSDKFSASGYQLQWLQKHSQCHEMVVSNSKFQTRVTLAFDTASLLRLTNKYYMGVAIASFEDVATGKLCAFQDRLEHRDILDVYFIMKKIHPYKLIQLTKKRWSFIDAYQIAKLFYKVDGIFPSLGAFKGYLLKKKLKREEIISSYHRAATEILNEILKK